MLTVPCNAFFLPKHPKYIAIVSVGPLIYTGYKALKGSKKAKASMKGILAYFFATLAVDCSYQSNPYDHGLTPEITAAICGLTSCALIESAFSDLYADSGQDKDLSTKEVESTN